MPFKMKCPGCTKVLDVPDSAVGKQAKCPACASVWQVSRPAEQPTASPTQKTLVGTKCPGCGRAIQILASMMGKRVKCPACASVWQVPGPFVEVEVVPEPAKADKEWFDDAMSDDYATAASQPMPTPPPVRPRATPSTPPRSNKGFFAPEKKGIAKGVLGGFVMMAIAVVWFFAGLYVGILFYYPPVLFLIGLYATLKGVLTGNLAGEK